jgi:subtilisin family serine protease
MAKVIGKEQLCSTDLKHFKALQGKGGKTYFDRYKSLENIIKNNIDAKYQDFLAYPVKDGEIIDFHGKKYNETPQHLSDLQGDELKKYIQIKNETLAHYRNKIDSLKNLGKNTEAEFLDDAIKYVDERFMYCYDDRVVLGIWGMQLRENIREDISEIRKDFADKKKPQPKSAPEPSDEKLGIEPLAEKSESYIRLEKPEPEPPIVKKTSWYKRFWSWFTGKGCLKWLFWLLSLLLLLLLLGLLLRSCNGCTPPWSGDKPAPIPYPIADKPWIHDDPRSGRGGIYNPGNPYDKPVPTPPEYSDVLPPHRGTLPPIDTTKIIRDPNNPAIIGNRLNVLMENENKSIMDLAKDFKAKYPDDKYRVVYYDDVVKRMQIEIPTEERIPLRTEIPAKFAPEYELFVFDEALFESSYTPNDPAFADDKKSWYLKAVNAPQAWDITKSNSGGKQLTVAIIDNGFSLKHPELEKKVVMPYNVWSHSKDIFPQKVDHGTHVAGTALAIMDNGIGISGIASEAAFMPVQVANKQGIMTTTSILDGILYALYQGADVINVSIGTKFPGNLPENVQYDMQNNRFKEEERLWNHVMKISDKHKVIIVMAAGNDNMLAGVDPMNSPKNFIIVSAVDKDNRQYRKAGFSNYGDYSTISAPGVDIYSTVGDKEYKAMNGTSMATPIVSGAVILMKNLNENLTVEQIICILQGTGLAANGKVGNVIQLDKALQKVLSGEFTDCDYRPETPSTGDVQVLLNWNNYNDLDLACVDPSKDMVWFKNKRVSSGGILEIDMNVKPNDNQAPIENIYWPQGKAPNGTYEVYLWLYKQHEVDINETPYEIMVKYGSKTEKFTGKIKKEDGRVHITTFTLGNTNNSRNPNNPNNPSTPPSNNRRDELLKERERFQQKVDEIDNELSNLNKKEKI